MNSNTAYDIQQQEIQKLLGNSGIEFDGNIDNFLESNLHNNNDEVRQDCSNVSKNHNLKLSFSFAFNLYNKFLNLNFYYNINFIYKL